MMKYPIDIHGIRRAGLESWYDTYSTPVLATEFQKIYDNILTIVVDLGRTTPNKEVYWPFICHFKVLISLAQHCFDYKRMMALKQAGYDMISRHGDESIDSVIQSLPGSLINGSFESKLHLIEHCRYHWRSIRTNWRHNNLFHSYFPQHAPDQFYLVGDRTVSELQAYAKARHSCPLTLQPRLYLKMDQEIDKQTKNEIADLIQAFTGRLTNDIPEFSAFSETAFAEYLQTLFINTVSMIRSCSKKLRHWKTRPLLINPLGNEYNRIFAVAWNSMGGKNIAFTHGNSYCMQYKPSSIRSGSHALVDEYIAGSSGEGALLYAAKNDFNIDMPTFRNVAVNPVNIYSSIHKKYRDMKMVKTVRKVMLIGYPMCPQYHSYHPEHHLLAQLYLEISIIKALEKAGFYIIYKAHPDTLAETDKLFCGLVDEVSTSSYESAFQNVDCVVMGSPATTVFGFSLLTKIPLVIINTDGNIWHPEVKVQLANRCGMVNAAVDKNGRIMFNQDEFIEAVKSAPTKMSDDLVKTYAL